MSEAEALANSWGDIPTDNAQNVGGYGGLPMQTPAADGSSFATGDLRSVLSTVASGVRDVAAGVLGFRQMQLEFQAQKAALDVARYKAETGRDVARLQAGTVGSLAQIEGATAIQRANNILTAERVKGAVAAGLSGYTGMDVAMLALTAIGVYLAWRALRH